MAEGWLDGDEMAGGLYDGDGMVEGSGLEIEMAEGLWQLIDFSHMLAPSCQNPEQFDQTEHGVAMECII